jgi:hypothetical protein
MINPPFLSQNRFRQNRVTNTTDPESCLTKTAAFATTAAANTAAVTAATTQPLIQIGPLTPFDKGILYGVCKP